MERTITINGDPYILPDGVSVRVYGKDATALELTDTARTVYNDSDPCIIYELVDDKTGACSYLIDGVYSKGLTRMSANEVNSLLEVDYASFGRDWI